MQQGAGQGQSEARPDDAKLYLGLAQSMAGDTAKAQATWQDGVKWQRMAPAILARLWVLHSRSAKR